MASINEDCIIKHSIQNPIDQPRSFRWQVFQGAHYIIGSLCFTIGSCMYFTKIFRPYSGALTLGGWLFIIGSFLFLFADLQDWWDYRTGYCFNYRYRPTSDIPLESLDTSISSEEIDRKKIDVNVYGSMIGLLFYLAGSILFLPIFDNYLAVGEWFFIFGSTFCCLSLLWKMYHLACNNVNERFRLRTLFSNIPTFLIDVCSLIGNLCFFIGTILYLSWVNTSDFDENRAAGFFVFGSTCFLISSLVLQYTICSAHYR